jgi:hypothetical protein
MLTQIGLKTGLHMAVPLLKALKHPGKKLLLVLKSGCQVVHIRLRRLVLEPYLGVRAAHTVPSDKWHARTNKKMNLDSRE